MNVTNIKTLYFNGIEDAEPQDASSVFLVVEACRLAFDIEIPIDSELKHVAQKLRLLANEIDKECEN